MQTIIATVTGLRTVGQDSGHTFIELAVAQLASIAQIYRWNFDPVVIVPKILTISGSNGYIDFRLSVSVTFILLDFFRACRGQKNFTFTVRKNVRITIILTLKRVNPMSHVTWVNSCLTISGALIDDLIVAFCAHSTGWAKKTAHGFFCNNFAYSQPIFIIFGLYKP